MNDGLRLFIGVVLFYLIYRLLERITDIRAFPILLFILIFTIYLFLPDMANEGNVFKENKNKVGLVALIGVLVIFLISKFIITSVVTLLVIIIFGMLIKNKNIFHSLPAGLLLSSPLYFINPIYFIFAFFGFLSFWITNKINY
jgi:hypothetical protein